MDDRQAHTKCGRPPQPRPWERRISQDEIDRLTYALGYEDGKVICTKRELVGLFFLLAIETGKRLGELCSLDHTSVHIENRYIQLDETKNGDCRQIPLFPRAVQLCEDFLKTDIRMTSPVASTLFRRAIELVEITNLHFHDTHHEAITRLSRKLDVFALARTVGRRDLKSLLIYYNETATELAGMLG